jgi:hypothetical protein
MELDPDSPNPTLFAMAPDTNMADASALGGPDGSREASGHSKWPKNHRPGCRNR